MPRKPSNRVLRTLEVTRPATLAELAEMSAEVALTPAAKAAVARVLARRK